MFPTREHLAFEAEIVCKIHFVLLTGAERL